MSNSKKFYWLKLMDDFFSSPKIKKLRRSVGNQQGNVDTCVIVYLKMLLLSISNNSRIDFQGIEPSFEEEISLTIDEDEEIVRSTINVLLSLGLLVKESDTSYFLPESQRLTGSEASSADRVRRHRERKKNECNVTQALHCNADVTPCNAVVTNCNVEIEKDKEKETEKDIELDLEIDTEIDTEKDNSCFKKPTVDEVIDFCNSIGHGEFDPYRFIDYYEKKNWMIGDKEIIDWKAKVIEWINRQANTSQKAKNNQHEKDWRGF